MKKAMELAILCDCEVSLIIIDEQGVASLFASSGSHSGTLDKAISFPPHLKKNVYMDEVYLHCTLFHLFNMIKNSMNVALPLIL